jgi:hypothetical protein
MCRFLAVFNLTRSENDLADFAYSGLRSYLKEKL